MRILCLAMAASLTACAVGPDYKRPPSVAPGATAPQFKESAAAGWTAAVPGTVDAAVPWWKGFGDPRLDDLIDQADHANQSIQLADANYRQAQALVQNAKSAWYPDLGASAGVVRQRNVTLGQYNTGDSHAWALTASWEPDLWGRVRRAVEGASDTAQASESDLAAARLAVRASVANDYLQLRMLDAEQNLFERTVDAYKKSLQITQSQFRVGTVTRADVDLANTTLQQTQALAIDNALTRKQLEHAIAVLVGKTPSEFSIAADGSIPGLPQVPIGVPSELLQRRPDISSAERRVASANAGIGYAQAAYYPNLSLTGSGGVTGGGFGNWFYSPAKVWALGAGLAGTLFDGGLRSAEVAQARAVFDASAATYRETVLNGFQEVEDNLAALNLLAQERNVQDGAVRSAQNAERVTLNQFRAGTTTYLAVITAQELALNNERTALQLEGRQFAANVALVKAVGGGWDASQLQASTNASPAATEPTISTDK
jgi:NodT family efflux transporter outer membrane factor (OMF) lipoprotein